LAIWEKNSSLGPFGTPKNTEKTLPTKLNPKTDYPFNTKLNFSAHTFCQKKTQFGFGVKNPQ